MITNLHDIAFFTETVCTVIQSEINIAFSRAAAVRYSQIGAHLRIVICYQCLCRWSESRCGCIQIDLSAFIIYSKPLTFRPAVPLGKLRNHCRLRVPSGSVIAIFPRDRERIFLSSFRRYRIFACALRHFVNCLDCLICKRLINRAVSSDNLLIVRKELYCIPLYSR